MTDESKFANFWKTAHGHFEYYIVTDKTLDRAQKLAPGGNVTARRIVTCTSKFAGVVCNAEPGHGVSCIGCETEFNKNEAPFAVLIITAFAGKSGVVAGVCSTCEGKWGHVEVCQRHLKELHPGATLEPPQNGYEKLQ